MNLDVVKQELDKAVNDGYQMVSVMLFRRKVGKQWQWRFDVKRIADDGTCTQERCLPIEETNSNQVGAGSFI